MVFIVLLVIVFGFVLSTMQFGSAPDGNNVTTATTRAQVYAVNMETWHQAAMLAAQADATDIANDTTDCPNAGQPCAISLNPIFWNSSASVPYTLTDKTNGITTANNNLLVQPALNGNWPEYVPVVSETATTGWQSFLIRNINGTSALATGTDSYVLTVFMGFGGCIGTNCNTATVVNNPGGLNNAQIATALAKTIQDRMGVGNLQCTSTVCSFTRVAAYTPPAGGVAISDQPLQFPTSAFTALNISFNGQPAIMTRVGSVASTSPGSCPAAGYEFDTSGNGQWKSGSLTVGTLDPNYYCAVNFSSTTAPSGPNAISPAIAASGYSVTSDATTTANCQSPSNSWQTTAPANLPICSNGGGGGGGPCSYQEDIDAPPRIIPIVQIAPIRPC